MMTEGLRQVDCVVIGAGITGLNLVYQLQKKFASNTGKPLNVLLVERKNRVGGAIQSEWCESESGQKFLIESGPNTFQGTQKTIHSLCEQLKLSPLASSSLAKNRYIYTCPGGQPVQPDLAKLIPLPMDPVSFLKSPLLSWQAKLNLMREPLRIPSPQKQTGHSFSLPESMLHPDQSISDFARYHFGQEVLDQILTPFLTGVYAGNPDELSLKSTFPKLAALEREHGSIIRGAFNAMWQARKNKKNSQPQSASLKMNRHLLYNFENGMQALPQALANAIPAEKQLLNATLVSLEALPDGRGYMLYFNEYPPCHARTVVFTAPADETAQYLDFLNPPVSRLLREIQYSPMAVIHLGFEKQALAHPLNGFGFLVPRTQNIKLLGSIFSSSLFPNRAPDNHVMLTCFLGGAFHPEIPALPEHVLINQVLSDLTTVFHLSEKPVPMFSKVISWARAIPQYTLGHTERIAEMNRHGEKYPGLWLTGNYRRGVSLNDCIVQGDHLADQVEQFLNARAYAESMTSVTSG